MSGNKDKTKPINLIFVYWDDFLFPTSYFHSNELKRFDEERLGRNKHVFFGELDIIAKRFLRSVLKYGNVSIISTRQREWINKTRNLLPDLDSFITTNKVQIYGIDNVDHPLNLMLSPRIIQGAINIFSWVGNIGRKNVRQTDNNVRKLMNINFRKDSIKNFIFFGNTDDDLADSRKIFSLFSQKCSDSKIGLKLIWLSAFKPKPDFIAICLHLICRNLKNFMRVEKPLDIVRVPYWNEKKVLRKDILPNLKLKR